jgi:hypothetical protein
VIRRDDYVTRLRYVLNVHGIRDYQFTRRRRHRAVRVMHAGKTTVVVFPSTGSDSRRGPRNAAANLRRALGLAGKEIRS